MSYPVFTDSGDTHSLSLFGSFISCDSLLTDGSGSEKAKPGQCSSGTEKLAAVSVNSV